MCGEAIVMAVWGMADSLSINDIQGLLCDKGKAKATNLSVQQQTSTQTHTNMNLEKLGTKT